MKRNDKKWWLVLLIAIITAALAVLNTGAVMQGYNWYCRHEKEHRRPAIPSELSFIEENGGWYLGKNPEQKVIYLTFDAGYENGNVEKILDILKEKEVPGAFFVLSHLITRNTDLIRRMVDEGHLVCNHTCRHKDMSTVDCAFFEKELRSLENLMKEKTGRELAPYYRPPEGRFSEENLKWAKEMGYQTIFWSFAYCDWDNGKQCEPEVALKKILDHVHNGEVMLLHPTSKTNAAIMGRLIDELKAQGYRFGTLDELTHE